MCRLVVVFIVLLLSACVTSTQTPLTLTNKSVSAKKIDKIKAIESHVSAASQYLRTRDAENAMRHLRKALDIDPDSPQVHGAMAYAFELTRDNDLAEKHHRKAIRIKNDKQTAMVNNYGVFLFKQGRYAEAKKQLTKAVADVLYPRRSSAFATLGLTEQRLANTETAEHAFERSLALDRRNGTALIELAAINLQKGHVVKAKQYYDSYRYLNNNLSPRSLLVGIDIASVTLDKSTLASNALSLKNLFPQSAEYAEYLRRYSND